MGAQGALHVESGNEWGTPWWVVQEAAQALGVLAFDLDPAATAGNAKAPRFFTRADNGLEQDWFGHVWLNPPFSRSLTACRPICARKSCAVRGGHLLEPQHGAADFARKVALELEAGRVRGLVWHGPVAPDTEWYGLLEPWTHYRIEYAGRIPYNDGRAGGTFPSQSMILRPERRGTLTVPTELRPLRNVGGGCA
jgi:phage N-6-adenine-methyltransferase